MDISVIDATRVTTKNGIVIGSSQAPKTIIEFMNLRCPYCKKWFEDSHEILNEAVSSGQVQRIIKLLDKEKESLQPGNVMHRYISNDQPELALTEISKIYQTQAEWGTLSLDAVAEFAQKQLRLTEHHKQPETKAIINEADAANIKFVPTIIIGTTIFDESISQNDLKKLLS